jgi:hypothetical protein
MLSATLWPTCARTMSVTSNSTCNIEAPVIVRVPAVRSRPLTEKDAEKILRGHGFHPTTAAERKRNAKFRRPAESWD